MYDVYLGTVLLPIAPKEIKMKINGTNETVTLIDQGEINILKTPGLTEVEFTAVIPQVRHPFANYHGGFVSAPTYLDALERMKTQKQHFPFIVCRKLPNGTPLTNTNIIMALEDYTIKDTVDEGFDFSIDIKLKRWVSYGTKKAKIAKAKKKVSTTPQRDASTAPTPKQQPKSYTVKKGDCLIKIAKEFYGDSSRWKDLYNANKGIVGGNPNLIYPGQTFTIPV